MNTNEIWSHVYDPFGNIWLSALCALIPIIFFFCALAVFRMKGHIAGTITLILSVIIAMLVFQMPVEKTLSSAVYGFIYGMWPIAWIIIAAVFLYKLSVKSGQFDVIRQSILSITDDQRLQMLLIGFAFGAFLEGAAGFGAPVAITAALLVGLGFKPLYAAGLCLIANTAPVAFGALGVPITVAGKVTGLDAFEIGAMTGRQLPFLSFFVPLWLVMIMDGIKGVKDTWPAAIVAGGSFAIVQYLTSNFIGPELPDITSSLASIIALTLFLKVWKPKNVMKSDNAEIANTVLKRYSFKELLIAWSPFLLLTFMVTIWTLNDVKTLFKIFSIKIEVPYLFESVYRVAPVAKVPTFQDATYDFNIIAATGTAIFLSAIISLSFLRLSIKDTAITFKETLWELRYPIWSIGMVLAFAMVMNFSGMSGTLAIILANTGVLFPFFSPFLGWLGVFLTGSDTSSNALFGGLQASTAEQLGMNQTLMVAANTSGGVTGKMISPQSIAVACAATGMVGKESDLFRFTLKHSLIFATVIGIITMLQSYVFTWMLVN